MQQGEDSRVRALVRLGISYDDMVEGERLIADRFGTRTSICNRPGATQATYQSVPDIRLECSDGSKRRHSLPPNAAECGRHHTEDDKLRQLTGYSPPQRMRTKAVSTLGTTEEGIDKSTSEKLSELGVPASFNGSGTVDMLEDKGCAVTCGSRNTRS